MRQATRASVRAGIASRTLLPPAVTMPLPELVSPVVEPPEPPAPAEAEGVAAPPVAADVASVLEGSG